MKFFALILVAIFLVFPLAIQAEETLTVKSLTKSHLDGTFVTRGDLIGNFGEYAFEAFQRNPKIYQAILKIKPDFRKKDVGTSFSTKFFLTQDGRVIVLLYGCTPHDCAGTENLIAYDHGNQKAYVLKESRDQERITLYGNPDRTVKNLMIHRYLNH